MLLPLAVALGMAGWASVASVSRTVGEREEQRIADAGSLLEDIARWLVAAPAGSEFLRQVASALGGEIFIHDRSRDAFRTTLDDDTAASFVARARSGALRTDAPPGSPTHVSIAGRPHLVLTQVVSEQDVYLVYPGDPVGDAVEGARRPLVIAAVLALLLAALLAVVLASLITRPLQRLAKEAAAVAGGDLDREVTVRSRDETGALAEAFNRMLAGLRRHRRDLVRSERLAVLGRIASGIAHELRNPLTAIRMNVQMLPDEEDPARRKDEVDLVLEEIDRLQRTVDDLMALARPSPLRTGEVDPRALIAGTLDLLARQLEHLGVTVEVDVPEDARTVFPGDERRLRQVLMNLLLNAAQAMPAGGSIRVSAARSESLVRITVADEGGGVPEDLRSQVFEPFVSGRPGGTGLGLAVSRQIVEAHGGEITLRELEIGTAVDVLLPASAPRAGR